MTIANIKELPYLIYDGLPISVKKLIRPLIRFFSLQSMISFISQLRPSVFLVYGKEKWGGENLSILFIGDEKRVHLLSNLLYTGNLVKESLGKVFIWRIKSKISLALHRIDFVFVIIEGFASRLLSRQGFFIIPEWVLFILDLSEPLEESWKLTKDHTLRTNLKRIKGNNFSYEVTQDQNKFKYYYHHMYLPYITKKFEELASLTKFHDMERIFRKGQLLLVKKGEDYVSGILLVRISGDTILAHSLGIIDGDIKYVRMGALSAVNYFSILWAKEKGYKWIDFGHGGSFLRYGLFNHKKMWGMRIKISRRVRNIFGIKIYNFSHGVQNLLEKNPFIFIDQNKLNRLIFVKNNHVLRLEDVKNCVKTYVISGLDCLVIVSDQGFDQEARNFASSCTTPKVQLFNSHFLQNNV